MNLQVGKRVKLKRPVGEWGYDVARIIKINRVTVWVDDEYSAKDPALNKRKIPKSLILSTI